MARSHIEPFCDRDVGFKKMTLPGFPNGMNYKMLSIDVDNGACTMTVQWDSGYKQPPGFSYTEYEMLIMEGGFKVGDEYWGKGSYFFVPQGVHLPAMTSETGAFAIVYYNFGPPTFQEADADHSDAGERGGLVMVDAYRGIDWIMEARRMPGVAPGCGGKVLHYDEKTGASTFMYCMVPGFWQDNISYHDCAEEGYHIWGTSWMMQFGNLPTGGYFWRPSYINHGCFASKYGIVAIGRTDGDLHNHFHHDPFSHPHENAERAAAVKARMRPAMYKWQLMHDHNHFPQDFEHPGDNYNVSAYNTGQIIGDDGSHWP